MLAKWMQKWMQLIWEFLVYKNILQMFKVYIIGTPIIDTKQSSLITHPCSHNDSNSHWLLQIWLFNIHWPVSFEN